MSGSAADRSEGVKSLILHDDEVRALQATGEVTVVRACKRRPPPGDWHAPAPAPYDSDPWYIHKGFGLAHRSFCLGRCPLGTPGERRWVKECWATVEPMVAYRADGIGPHNDLTWRVERWHSAVHMPQEASRLTAECASVTADRRAGLWEWHAVYRRVAA